MLAAGAGTRLRPLTDHLPKALCPVDNVALVDLALSVATGVTADVAVNIHHRRDLLEPHLHGRVHISIEEPWALGTSGAIGQLRDWVAGRPLLVLNADAWRAGDVAELITGWDGDRVRLLVVEDPARGDFGSSRHAGASLLPWRVASQLVPEPGGLYETVWRHEYAAGRLDFARARQRFIDCGTPQDYLTANMAASGGCSVIGRGAVVEGELVRSVVWPGGRVFAGELLVDAIRVGETLTVAPGGLRT